MIPTTLTMNSSILISIICGLVLVQTSIEGAKRELPELWSAIKSSSYHIQYQLEMAGSPEILTIEEWASFKDQEFRLDLISSTSRTSYLTNGKTGEMFRYKPFTCEPITSKSDEFQVFDNLFLGGYPLSDPAGQAEEGAMLAYGLGPLWLRAREKALSVDYLQADPLNPLTIDNKHKLSVDFDQYILGMPIAYSQGKGSLRLRFLFPVGLNHFVEMVDWLLKDNTGRKSVQARARLVELDVAQPPDRSVFKIPVGYGCTRSDKINKQLGVQVGLTLLHDGFPNQISLAVATSRPNDDILAASSSWSTHKYSVSLTRHSMVRPDGETESYFVSLIQERDEQTSRLKKSKRIWWLPTNKVNVKTQALVYEFDLSSSDENNCEMSHRNVKDQLVLDFPGSSRTDTLMVLSLDQIVFLFQDQTNYHLLSKTEEFDASIYDQTDGTIKSLYYEKRVNHFELTYEGYVVWSGPVSIVKQVNSYSRYMNQQSSKKAAEGNENSSKRLKLSDDYRTTLTLFFYSKDFLNLEFKAVIELLGNHQVDLDYLHKQLDISSCFSQDKQRSILIKYPIERPDIIKELEAQQEAMRAQLYQNLFDKTILNPLQITNLDIAFDYFNLQLRMTLLDLPLTHTFKVDKGVRLIRDNKNNSPKDRNALIATSASSSEKCADQCEHYNCFRFSYEGSMRECHIEVIRDKLLAIEHPTSELYSHVNRWDSLYWRGSRLAPQMSDESRPHLSPRVIVEMFEQMLLNEQSSSSPDSEGLNPLNLRLMVRNSRSNDRDQSMSTGKQDKRELTLRPNSIEADYEAMEEYVQLNKLLSGGADNDELFKLDGQLMRLQYIVLMEDRAYNDDVGQTVNGLSSYDDCAQFCENTDCRTFSYCQHDEECRVTNFHDEKFVSRYSKPRSFSHRCNVHSLDYLSKFEPYGQMVAPATAARTSDGSSERDCANICMDEQSFTCQGFYFCRTPAKSLIGGLQDVTRCHLIDKHVDNFMGRHQLESYPINSTGGESNADTGREECSFFSRSYLAQFDKFYGKRIDFSTSSERRVVLTNADAEHCAMFSIERSHLAFDVCSTVLNVYNSRQCHFTNNPIAKSRIKADPKCTTFVLADKSQYNKSKLKLIEGEKPDQRAPVEMSEDANGPQKAVLVDEKEDSLSKNDINLDLIDKLDSRQVDELNGASSNRISGWHSFWRVLWSLAVGVSFGALFVVVWNEAYARGWFDQLTNRRRVSPY